MKVFVAIFGLLYFLIIGGIFFAAWRGIAIPVSVSSEVPAAEPDPVVNTPSTPEERIPTPQPSTSPNTPTPKPVSPKPTPRPQPQEAPPPLPPPLPHGSAER